METATIQYVIGDATAPSTPGKKIIVHVCNDLGAWGKGFVMALSKRWSEPEQEYRKWHATREQNDFGLGAVQFVQVQPDLWIANLIGQHGLRHAKGVAPIRYEAVRKGLESVGRFAQKNEATVHMPRIGCGLAGGKWKEIEALVKTSLIEQGIAVTIYDWSNRL